MSEIKCTHSCSDCSRLGCRSASEDQYPPFCLTTNVDRELLDETLEIYRNDELQGRIARTSACIRSTSSRVTTCATEPMGSVLWRSRRMDIWAS